MTMVERRKPLLTFRSYNNGERLGEEDGFSWFSSKMVSRDSQEEGERIYVIKAPFPPRKRDMQEESGWKRRKEELVFLKLQMV